MRDISICITTYNRAEKLRQCLDYLSTFSDQSFELIVGNNASSDHTDQVVAEMAPRFQHFLYVRHPENLGFARNMDSLLRQATRQYIHILNDDDIVFEAGLQLIINTMNANPKIAAMVGQYLSLRALDTQIQIDYSDTIASTVAQHQYLQLINNLSICDGHPIIRRSIFERYCAYLDRTGTLIPLYFKLLQYGDIVSVNKPIFQHRTSQESLTARMAEAWFLDMANTDLEVAISGCLETLPATTLIESRQRLLQLIYLQAARMSVSRQMPYLVWLFLRRLQAVAGASPDLLVQCEYHFCHDMLLDRLQQRLSDSERGCCYYIPSTACNLLVTELKQRLPTLAFTEFDANTRPDPHDYLICDQYHPQLAATLHLLALADLFTQIRLSNHAAQLAVLEQRLVVQYQDATALTYLQMPSQAFQIVCAPYSEM